MSTRTVYKRNQIKKKQVKSNGIMALLSRLSWTHYLGFSLALYVTFFYSEHLSFAVFDLFPEHVPNSSIENFVAFLITLSVFTSFFVFLYTLRIRTSMPRLTINSLLSKNWEDLEKMTERLFQSSGYKTISAGGAQADGGVDLIAYKWGKKTIVQCKHYKKSNVGVAIVREMFGVMMHEKASRVFIITCGKFTKDAVAFAKGKPIILIDGERFVYLNNRGRL